MGANSRVPHESCSWDTCCSAVEAGLASESDSEAKDKKRRPHATIQLHGETSACPSLQKWVWGWSFPPFLKGGLMGIVNLAEKAPDDRLVLSPPRDMIVTILCGSTLIPAARDVTVTRIRNLSRRA